MRIITGTARGRKLVSLPGEDTRPTAERVKEAVFSIIQFEVEGRRFLDLFAGSGQMGLEALSRGAASAVLVDSAKPAVEVIRQNAASTGLEQNAQVVAADYQPYLLGCKGSFDIAFLDPPYSKGILPKALELLVPHMSDSGLILCEHRKTDEMPAAVGPFTLRRQYRYGQTLLSAYRKGEETP